MTQIYGKVNQPEDIRRINCIIRDEMLNVETEEQLTDLKKRSDYLCTLTYSPFWKKKFWPMIEQLREIALEENRITVRLANYISTYKNFNKTYDAWGEDNETIEQKLENLPKQIIEELTETTIELKLSPEILDDIRKSYCKIRAWMILSKSEIQLTLLKKQSDLIKAIVYTQEFKERFEEEYDKVLQLVNKEEERTIKLANIIAEINKYEINYEIWTEDAVEENETLEQYIENLLKEEEKSDTYIPTEAKYRQWTTYWLVYDHPTRNRKYAKRIYFSGSIKNITLDWPGMFENKFGKKVYGVKITYYTYVRPTTIHRNNVEIHLPERWVKKTKVVELPKWVKEVQLLETRPEFAYPVA